MFIPVNQRKIDIFSNISSLLSILVNIGMILSYTVILSFSGVFYGSVVFVIHLVEIFVKNILKIFFRF